MGDGKLPNDVMVVGEAPGRHEDEEGIPFVGRVGELLEELFERAGLDLNDAYITNAVRCRPPDNRTPRKSEITACRPWMNKERAKSKAKFVLLLGNTALQSVLGVTGIKKLRGRPIEQDGVIYLPTYHPSYVLRDPRHRATVQADIEFFSQIIECGQIPREEGLNFVIVNDSKTLNRMVKDLRGEVSFDIETTCLYPWGEEAAITSIGFGTKNYQWLIPWNHSDSKWNRSEKKAIITRFDKIIGRCSLIMQSGKFDALWMKVHCGVWWHADFDTMLAHYLLDENAYHGLKILAKAFFGAPDYDLPLDEKQGNVPYLKLAEYHALDLYYTRKLKPILAKKLKLDGSVNQVFEHIMMPCVRLFAEAEYEGVYINTKQMKKVGRHLRRQIRKAERVLAEYGEDVNWGSPQQVGVVLFDELKLKVIERTKGGARATNESVLKRLDHPVCRAILDLRAASKQHSSFIKGWEPYLVGGYIHPSFKLHGTVTGRLSCEHPNLQQVPRDPVIRSLVTAPPGWTLVEGDLGQIELRIAAELAQERAMLDAFNRGEDIHWKTAMREISRAGGQAKVVEATAAKYLGRKVSYSKSIEALIEMGPDKACEIDPAWKELRKKAKAINFGYLFGMWWKRFKTYALDDYGIVVTDREAEASRKNYFQLYPGLKAWHDKQRNFARRNGYVTSLSGRKRRLPNAQLADDSPARGEAQRQAINSPVQSFANEMNLMAAIQLKREFGRDVLRICGTVHDSILFRVRNDMIEKIVPRIERVMCHPQLLDDLDIRLRVPIEAEVKIGPWSKGVNLKQWLELR